MDIQKVVDYWMRGATEDLQTAKDLFQTKHYANCLFFCHLALEKALKAMVVRKIKKHAPYFHQLNSLADIAQITRDSEQTILLDEITSFNIKGRYPDYLTEFSKKYTKKDAQKYLLHTQKLLSWLQKQ